MRKLCFMMLAVALVAGETAYASCVFCFTGTTTTTQAPGSTANAFALNLELDDTNDTVDGADHAVIVGANSFVDFGGAVFSITGGLITIDAAGCMVVSATAGSALTNTSGSGNLQIMICTSFPFGAPPMSLADYKDDLNTLGTAGGEVARIGSIGSEVYDSDIVNGKGQSFTTGVPEPSTMIGIFAFGIFGIGFRRRRDPKSLAV
ncbi:PEP-CTERM sorting domain-containing protein [bacterium]|nr:PEP-CTERM sorting domain-containing protein [bacterium]